MAPSDFFPLPELPQDLQRLEQWLSSREAAQPGIRPDNQARIVWHDPSRLERTRYSIVYLHGFTASQGEGDPQHRRLAEALQGNLYLPRLPGHGLSEDGAMRGIRAEYWIEAATETLAIGHTLGEQVILVGTSMGATLAIQLAAAHPSSVAAVLAWSPGVRVRDHSALQALCERGDEILTRSLDAYPPERRRYSSAAAHVDGYRSLYALFQRMQPALFRQVHAPLFLACYYKDEQEQDPTSSVAAMDEMFDALGTPSECKLRQAYANASHVIASPWRSAEAERVYQDSLDFLRRVLNVTAEPS